MGQTQTIGRRATRITTENGMTRVRYHDTDVVTFDREIIILDHGGWLTVTTKARMNQTANRYGLAFVVYQKDFDWFVRTDYGTFPFTGRIFTLDRVTMKSMAEKAE